MLPLHHDWPSRKFSPEMPGWGWGWNCCCDTPTKYHNFGGVKFSPTASTDTNTEYVVDAWTTKTVMPTVRFAAPAYHLSAAYVVTGATTILDTRNDKYVGSTDSWSTRTAITAHRQHPAPFSVGLFAYCAGGDDSANNSVDTNYKYDEAGDSWATKAVLPAVRAEPAGASTTSYGYAVGGEGTFAQFWQTSNYQYSVAGDSWATKTAIVLGRQGASGLGLTGKIYIALGLIASGPTYTKSIVEYDETGNSWTDRGSLSVVREWAGSGELDGLNTGYFTSGLTTGVTTASNAHDEWTPNSTLTRAAATTVHSNCAARA